MASTSGKKSQCDLQKKHDEDELINLVCAAPKPATEPEGAESSSDMFSGTESDSQSEPAKEDVAADGGGEDQASTATPPASQGRKSFDTNLMRFLRDSRRKEATERKKLEALTVQSQQHVALLKKNKAVITNPANLTFDERFKSLLRAFGVGKNVRGNSPDDTEASRRTKTALAVKCVASEQTRERLGDAIDRKVHEVENAVLEKKRDYYTFLCKEVSDREKEWNKSREAELRMVRDYEALEQRFRGWDPSKSMSPQEEKEYAKYVLMRDIRDAQANLSGFKDEERRLGKEARQRKRTRVEPPGKIGEPAKKLRVHNSKKKSDHEIVDQASASITKFVMDWQETVTGHVDVAMYNKPSYIPSYEDPTPDPPDPRFTHEEDLHKFIWPKSLRTESWATVDASQTGGDQTDEGGVDVGRELVTLIREMQSVQHLHTLALHTALEAIADVRLAVAKDGQQEMQLAKELKAAQRATLLATDADLKQLPFRSIKQICQFFLSAERVAKLSKYLCHYVRYSKKYAHDVNAALLHPDLQAVVYWPGTVMRGTTGASANIEYLPKLYQIYLERIGHASHTMEHFYLDCAFDYTLFNERMRASLYKPKKDKKGGKVGLPAAAGAPPKNATE